MTVTAKIVDQSSTNFRVEFTATTTEQVLVSLYRPGGEIDKRPVQTVGRPGQIPPTVLFENLEPRTPYRVTVESSSGTQELQASTTS